MCNSHSVESYKQFLRQSHVQGSLINQDLLVTSMSACMANWLNYGTEDKAIGTSDYDINAPAVKHADVFRAQDMEVFGAKKSRQWFEVLTYANDELKFLLSEKSYIFDAIEKKPYLLATHQEIKVNNLQIFACSNIDIFKQGASINLSYRLVETIGQLSPVESEVLFFLMRGKTAKQVAFGLSRSHRTIEDHIAHIRNKFSCKNKNDIIDYCFIKNYINLMPRSLLLRHVH